MVKFGQIVVGPPGSGKTTYCFGMLQFLQGVGRKAVIVNLDFANEKPPYSSTIDVRDLIALENVMEDMNLGPNGSLVFCMEYLLENISWLDSKLSELETDYVIFDCPGQVEMYTHHHSVEQIVKHLCKKFDFRLCSVYLVDSFYCCDPSTFISAVLIVVATMLRLGLPHISILSKIDILPRYGKLPFHLDFFTEALDLSPLADYVVYSPEELQIALHANPEDGNDDHIAIAPTNTKKKQQLKAMTESLCSVLEDFGMVSFVPLAIQDPETLARVLYRIDRATGYSVVYEQAKQVANSQSPSNDGSTSSRQQDKHNVGSNIWKLISTEIESTYERSIDILERYQDPHTSKN